MPRSWPRIAADGYSALTQHRCSPHGGRAAALPPWTFVRPGPHATGRRSPARGLDMNEQRPAASLQRFFGAPLAETDPELAAALGAELIRQQDGIELIASENIVSAAVLEAQGSVLTNKYAEGYPGPALLRRLRVCRRRRAAGDRPGQAAVRLRVRQRAAAFRRAGEPGGVPGAAAAGRHDPGHEPRRRRPPDPRRARPTCPASGSAPCSTACGATTGCWTTRSWNGWRARRSRS